MLRQGCFWRTMSRDARAGIAMGDVPCVLVVDRDPDVLQVVSELTATFGFSIETASTGEEMRALLDAGGVDLIVLDATASEADQVDLAVTARERGIRLIMMSGNPTCMEAFHERADQLLWKPFHRSDLKRAIEVALASDVRGQRKEDLVGD
jgi:DNA-binding response OmpR family regulator